MDRPPEWVGPESQALEARFGLQALEPWPRHEGQNDRMDIDGDAADAAGTGVRAGRVANLDCTAVPAKPERLPELRHALAEWAARIGMAAEQNEALTLATYEALANAAAHAYPEGVEGVVDVHAVHRPESARVEVTVTDYGSWRPPDESGMLGGRGLVLVRSLAENAEVTTDASGTTVRMAWSLAPGPR